MLPSIYRKHAPRIYKQSRFVVTKMGIEQHSTDAQRRERRERKEGGYLFALRLPHFIIISVCSSVQASKSADLTLEICVPIPLCIPEQRIQMKTPKDHDAQRGCVLT